MIRKYTEYKELVEDIVVTVDFPERIDHINPVRVILDRTYFSLKQWALVYTAVQKILEESGAIDESYRGSQSN